MLASFIDRIAAAPRRILIAAALVTVVAGAIGGPIFGLLESSGGFTDRGSDSNRAVERVEQATGAGSSPAVILLYTPSSPVVSSAGKADLSDIAAGLEQIPGVVSVESAATSSDQRLISADGNSTYLAATLANGADEDEATDALDSRFGERDDVVLGGELYAGDQLGEQVSKDLGRAELFAFPLLFILSVVFFRGFRAVLIPLTIGMATVLGTFLVLRLINEFFDLSIFSLNLVIGLGLGLAIDYSLFLLTRYREELRDRGPGTEAIRATMTSAGSTVLFSAVTVAIALASLLIFPLRFLQSMAIGGAVVALVAALAATVIAPAFFALWNVKLAARERPGAHDRWSRIAHGVMSRPGPIAAITALVMLALAVPAVRANWTPVSISTVPEGLSARTVGDALADDFTDEDSSPVLIVAGGDRDEVDALARDVGAADGIAAVAEPERLDGATWRINAIAEGDAAGSAARGAVETIRADHASLDVLVGGEAAEFIDQQDAIGSRLPLAVALLALLTFSVLWLMTGSVILPLKALVMNALTVGATLGALALVFQDGRFEGLLGYTANGGIEPTDFLVTATLVFALSTDYGVFLLGRIKEARDSGLPDREAVAAGLGRTGSVVTAAAILLAVAIGAFVTSEVLFIKQIGIGTAFGVLVDALVVRALLVPSLMALLGPWNWWSPAPMRRLHDRLTRGGSSRELSPR